MTWPAPPVSLQMRESWREEESQVSGPGLRAMMRCVTLKTALAAEYDMTKVSIWAKSRSLTHSQRCLDIVFHNELQIRGVLDVRAIVT